MIECRPKGCLASGVMDPFSCILIQKKLHQSFASSTSPAATTPDINQGRLRATVAVFACENIYSENTNAVNNLRDLEQQVSRLRVMNENNSAFSSRRWKTSGKTNSEAPPILVARIRQASCGRSRRRSNRVWLSRAHLERTLSTPQPTGS